MTRTPSASAAARFYAAVEIMGYNLEAPYTRSHDPVACKCPVGHPCFLTPNKVAQGRGGCAVCSRKSKAAAIVWLYAKALADGVTIMGDYINNKTPIWCICHNRHNCWPRPNDIQQGQGWCKTCAHRDKSVGEANFRATIAAGGGKVKGAYTGALDPTEVTCSLDHTSYPRPNSVQQGQGFCQQCNGVFDRLYLVVGKFDGVWWAKVGIASGASRVKMHAYFGWQPYRQWVDLDHNDAWHIEAAITVYRRNLKWPNIDQALMPQDGYTETFPLIYMPTVERWVDDLTTTFA